MRKTKPKKGKMMQFMLIIFGLLIITSEVYIRCFTSYCEPHFDKNTKIVKRKKNTEGIYKTRYTNTGYFEINNEGWNSWRNYNSEKPSNTKRIAIVGHSNIEGLRVPIEKTLSKVLEDKLLDEAIEAEVYTFGYGGMHLAQALHISRYVVKEFQPDILIIGTLLDDFIYKSRHKDFFLSLEVLDENQINEVLPEEYTKENDSSLSFLYFSKAVKYIDIRFGFSKKLKHLTAKKTLKSESSKRNHYPSVIDSVYEQKVLSGANYILKEFNEISSHSQLSQYPQIYFIDFPLKVPSYNYHYINIQPDLYYHHNKIIELVNSYKFTIICPEQALIADYTAHHQKLDFPMDRHYNEYAHSIIGGFLANYFLSNNLIER